MDLFQQQQRPEVTEKSLEKSLSEARFVDLQVPPTQTLTNIPFPPLSEFRVRWIAVGIYVVLHLSLVAGIWCFSLDALLFGLVTGYISGILGISVGYHRLLTHSSFETYRWIKIVHLFIAVTLMQLGPITWARTHKVHHAKADTYEDPHAQIFGFWWGLCGWIFLSHPRIGRSSLSKHIGLNDLTSDPAIMFLEKHWFSIFLLTFVPLYIFGGWTYVVWGGCFRVLSLSYLIWFLNSGGHGFGSRDFDTQDRSTNSMTLSLMSGGEGWHNNHHAFPASAKFGLKTWQIDFGWYWICLLKFLGLAWNVKTPASYAPGPR